MLAAEDFIYLCRKAINRNVGLWPKSWRERAGKIGGKWLYANLGAEDLLSADLYVKYCRELASVRQPGGWIWAQVLGELKRLARMERNGGLTGRKEGTSRAVSSWDAREGWRGPQGDGAISLGYGEGSSPAVSLTDWAAGAEWEEAEETEEADLVDPARFMQRAMLSTELQCAGFPASARTRFPPFTLEETDDTAQPAIVGRLALVRCHPCRSERFKRPWINPANPGLTDAQLRAKYPQGYAAMSRNPRRPTEGPTANCYGPVSWHAPQDKKTLFKGTVGLATFKLSTTETKSAETRDYAPKCWWNGARYRKPRYHYSWQMEAYRCPWLCMLRGFVPRTMRGGYRAWLTWLIELAAIKWAHVVEADKTRFRDYDLAVKRK